MISLRTNVTFLYFSKIDQYAPEGGGGEGTPIHYLYGYVRPNGFVLLI